MNTAGSITVKILAVSVAFAAGIAARPSLYRLYDQTSLKKANGDAAPGVPAHYENRRSLFSLLKHPQPVVFLGDSRIEVCDWSELLGVSVSNRGISSDTTKGVIDRIAVSAPAGIKVCVVQVGYNDLAAGVTPDRVASNLATIVRAISGAHVIVTSIIPGANGNPELNARIADANAKAEIAVKAAGAEWLDVSPAIAVDGHLGNELSSDGIHLNGAGYDKLRPVILKALDGRISLPR